MVNLEFKETSLMYGDKEVSVAYLNDTEVYSSGLPVGTTFDFPYTAKASEITLPNGKYKLECWGAMGGYRSSPAYAGKGGYSVGTLTLTKPTKLYVYAGGAGNAWYDNATKSGFNGGGQRSNNFGGGGGASDIRIGTDSLYARVIVAGGGGSDGAADKTGLYGGGITGGSASEPFGTGGLGATQTGLTDSSWQTTAQSSSLNTQAGARSGFGFGGNGISISAGYGGAGGGGWYGGSGSSPDGSGDDDRGGGGGSGYVYTFETQKYYPSGCLLNETYYLRDAQTIAGNKSFPSVNGGVVTGHNGNGHVRITYTGKPTKIKKQLQYIRSTGTQYINTEYLPNHNTKINMKVRWDAQSTICYFFGLAYFANDTVALGLLYSAPSNTFYFRYGTNRISPGLSDFSELDIKVDKNIIYINADSYTAPEATFTTTYPLYLFANNSAGTVEQNITMWLYLCQIYDNYTLVRDFVPVLTTDNLVGLWDKVTNNFYPSESSDPFIASEPKQYTYLEYLEKGPNEYIDTNYQANYNTRVICDFQIESYGTDDYLYGASDFGFLQAFAFLSNLTAMYGNYTSTGFNVDKYSRHVVDQNKNTITLDGVTQSVEALNFLSWDLYLFANNRSGNAVTTSHGKKIYSCKIYDDDTLVRDYIPAQDENGKKGLYDKCTKLFYELKS